jgi:predicted DNA-binding mobile mystery protein A
MKDYLTAIRQLDRQLLALKEQGAYLVPKQGWVRTLRKTLGMTLQQLARRLNVNPSRIVKIETAELEGAVTLQTLKSVAEAMDCTFVYSFLPRTSLESTVKSRARFQATQQVNKTAHTMHLEAQTVDPKWLETQVHELSDKLLRKSWRDLWKE